MLSTTLQTTTTTLHYFVRTMILRPDIQRRAQEELDTVLGSRLPSIEDQDSLPYVQALIYECMRWHPATPLGISNQLPDICASLKFKPGLPHKAMQDDVYDSKRG